MTKLEEEIKNAIQNTLLCSRIDFSVEETPEERYNRLTELSYQAAAEVAKRYIGEALVNLHERNVEVLETTGNISVVELEINLHHTRGWLKENGVIEPLAQLIPKPEPLPVIKPSTKEEYFEALGFERISQEKAKEIEEGMNNWRGKEPVSEEVAKLKKRIEELQEENERLRRIGKKADN